VKTNQVQKGPAREEETTAKGKRQKAGVLFLKGEGEGEDVGFNFFFFLQVHPGSSWSGPEGGGLGS
jgi:hypothetical protein